MTDSLSQRTSGVDSIASTWQRERIHELEQLLHERETEIASLRRRVADTETQILALQHHNGHVG